MERTVSIHRCNSNSTQQEISSVWTERQKSLRMLLRQLLCEAAINSSGIKTTIHLSFSMEIWATSIGSTLKMVHYKLVQRNGNSLYLRSYKYTRLSTGQSSITTRERKLNLDTLLRLTKRKDQSSTL